MIIFVSLKKFVQTFWWLIAAIALYVFYQSIGLNMFFLLIIGLLALKFVPALVLPILFIALGVYFSGGFSFMADLIILFFWGLFHCPFVLLLRRVSVLRLSERGREINSIKGVILNDKAFFGAKIKRNLKSYQ
ncbi:Uncharacterised protein [Streptococcus agalactiae]|uniref:Uncharacterized protein n=1 Tax=Streptococcus agalactiae TaxID=1311 RepID=A0AAX2L2E7_STRAG|nr:hypothetical protein [Streptococcus agalactiae]SUN10628.1 Uncharacterised protein [Streptococcus agalactiae]SUN25295.1 Uncharacterised protein [Streptococcus agalactiae]VED64923.1 Uncharacterised protein [Streptococcus agalactiae]